MNKRYKYKKTYHLPWSPGCINDDKMLDSLDSFIGKEIVVTEKMDGENTSLYPDGLHARSIDSKHHPSRDYVKAVQGGMGYTIPEGWRVCGENMFALHSIPYDNLESYFLAFSVWNDQNVCLSWDETVDYCTNHFGIKMVPILWRGTVDERKLKEFGRLYLQDSSKEGYVIRLTDSFHYNEFEKSVAKFVRPHHIQTDEHWMSKEVIPNQLKKLVP